MNIWFLFKDCDEAEADELLNSSNWDVDEAISLKMARTPQNSDEEEIDPEAPGPSSRPEVPKSARTRLKVKITAKSKNKKPAKTSSEPGKKPEVLFPNPYELYNQKIKKNECPLCPKKYAWSDSLSKHMREAHDTKKKLKKSNQCVYCGEVLKSSMRRHLEKVHGIYRREPKSTYPALRPLPLDDSSEPGLSMPELIAHAIRDLDGSATPDELVIWFQANYEHYNAMSVSTLRNDISTVLNAVACFISWQTRWFISAYLWNSRQHRPPKK